MESRSISRRYAGSAPWRLLTSNGRFAEAVMSGENPRNPSSFERGEESGRGDGGFVQVDVPLIALKRVLVAAVVFLTAGGLVAEVAHRLYVGV